MTYATVAELKAVSGSYFDSVTLQALLDDADRKIKNQLTVAEIPIPSADDGLKSACLCLAKAAIIRRVWTDGEMNAMKDDHGNHMNTEVKDLTDEAAEYISGYALAAPAQRYRWNIRKVNS